LAAKWPVTPHRKHASRRGVDDDDDDGDDDGDDDDDNVDGDNDDCWHWAEK
jgi:hypothetical protein